MSDLDLILEKFPDKQLEYKNTTSKKWKKDTIEFFQKNNIQLDNVLEIGTNYGWTTLLFSYFCKNIYSIDIDATCIEKATELCSDRPNTNIILGDAYKPETYNTLPKYFDAVIIDCIHTYPAVKSDIQNSLNFFNPNKGMYFIFDDYSHPESSGVNRAINESIEEGLTKETYVGESKGYKVTRINGSSFTLFGPEGIILSYGV